MRSKKLSNVVAMPAVQTHPDYHLGFNGAQRGEPLYEAECSAIYRAGWKAFWVAHGLLQHASSEAHAFYHVPVPPRPAEDLTPEGIQLVFPGAERVAPATQKQLDLF